MRASNNKFSGIVGFRLKRAARETGLSCDRLNLVYSCINLIPFPDPGNPHDMKVAELKDELEARGASTTAHDKMALRLWLRALMLRAALDTRRAEEGGGG